MIRHHPQTDLLLDYATGSLPGAVALVVAGHACLCADCRAQVARMDAVGGALIDHIEPVTLSTGALDRALSRLDDEPPEAPPPILDAQTRALVPTAIRPYLKGNIGDLRWRWRGPSLREARLELDTPSHRASLFRIRPGAAAPVHRHEGSEYTLVLDGSFAEDGETYAVGDFASAEAGRAHVQHADATTGCMCLTVLDAPVRLTGVLGALINPFLRF